ncbi:MAG: sugar phosphate isomerase/epimerase [Victivallales bacterium]|nr:sugar phosphate isomerase/epimerase [Victivallales bacterium]
MLPKAITHFISSKILFGESLDERIEKIREAGFPLFTFPSDATERLICEPELLPQVLQKAERCRLEFVDAHTPCSSNQWMLNCGDPEQRKNMLEGFARALEFYPDFGIQRAVIHVGNSDHYHEHGKDLAWARDLTCDALDRLLPVAERNNIIICIENTLFDTDTASELLFYLSKYPSKYLKVCYDSGHANAMEPAPWKTSDQMQDWIQARWKPLVQFEENALEKLLPHVVTCHLHDNHGTHDEHLIPGTGTINWDKCFATLATAPNLQSLQDESHWPTDIERDIAFWNKYL